MTVFEDTGFTSFQPAKPARKIQMLNDLLDDDIWGRLSARQESTTWRVLDDDHRRRPFTYHESIAWHLLDNGNNKKYHSNGADQSAKPD